MRLLVQVTSLLLFSFYSEAQTSFVHLLSKKLNLTDSGSYLFSKVATDSAAWKENMLDQVEQHVEHALVNSLPSEINSELNVIQNYPLQQIDINSDFKSSSIPDGSWAFIQDQLGILRLNALSHFSGKDEVLQNAFTNFSDLKRNSETVKVILKKSDSTRRASYPAFTQFVIGFFRPDAPSLTYDLFPGIGFYRPSGWVFQFGYTRRVTLISKETLLSGFRIGTAYLLNHGLSVQLEAERLSITHKESIRNRLHLLGSVRKTIPIYGSLYSFVQLAFDFGHQISLDGYPERYTYRAGIEFRQKSRKR